MWDHSNNVYVRDESGVATAYLIVYYLTQSIGVGYRNGSVKGWPSIANQRVPSWRVYRTFLLKVLKRLLTIQPKTYGFNQSTELSSLVDRLERARDPYYRDIDELSEILQALKDVQVDELDKQDAKSPRWQKDYFANTSFFKYT